MQLRTVFLVALLVSCLHAQDPQAGGSAAPADIPVYLPGGEEAGPTLPSQRGISAIRSQGNLVRITPYLGLMAVYDTALAPLVSDETGNILNRGSAGMSANFGVAGTRPFRQSVLTVAYRGSYLHYPNNQFLSGSNHFGILGFNHMFSRKLTLSSSNSIGYIVNPFFGNFGFPTLPGSNVPDPSNEPFNNPMLMGSTNQQITYQKSARLFFSAGGGGFLQSRRSEALVDVYGANVTGTIGYRASRRQTVGLNYTFGQFFFDKAYGGSNVHTLSAEWAYQFSQRSEITLNAGGSRVESQALQTVELDPILARLLGVSSGIEAVYRKNYLPTFGAGYRWGGRSWTFDANASRAVNAGNGIVLTNMGTNVSTGLRYTGGRNWNVGVRGAYAKFGALHGTTRQFDSVSGSVGFTVRLASGISWTSNFSARQFGLGQQANGNPLFDRTQYRVQTGITWHPGDYPLPLF